MSPSVQTIDAVPSRTKQSRGLEPHSWLPLPYRAFTRSMPRRRSAFEANRLYCRLTISRYVQLNAATAFSSGSLGGPHVGRMGARMAARSSCCDGVSLPTTVVTPPCAELGLSLPPPICVTSVARPTIAAISAATAVINPVPLCRNFVKRDIRPSGGADMRASLYRRWIPVDAPEARLHVRRQRSRRQRAPDAEHRRNEFLSLGRRRQLDVGRLAAPQFAAPLGLRVDLRAEEERDAAQPEPRH